MRTNTPPEPDIPDLEVPPAGAASGPPPRLDLEDAIERSPSFPPPDALRMAGEWAEYSEPSLSADDSVPPPRASGFIRARRLTSDVEEAGFPFFPPARPASAARRGSWAMAFGPGVLLVAASVVMTFFDQRGFPLETLRAGELSSRPPTWIAALTCCAGLLSIALGARRYARGRYF